MSLRKRRFIKGERYRVKNASHIVCRANEVGFECLCTHCWQAYQFFADPFCTPPGSGDLKFWEKFVIDHKECKAVPMTPRIEGQSMN